MEIAAVGGISDYGLVALAARVTDDASRFAISSCTSASKKSIKPITNAVALARAYSQGRRLLIAGKLITAQLAKFIRQQADDAANKYSSLAWGLGDEAERVKWGSQSVDAWILYAVALAARHTADSTLHAINRDRLSLLESTVAAAKQATTATTRACYRNLANQDLQTSNAVATADQDLTAVAVGPLVDELLAITPYRSGGDIAGEFVKPVFFTENRRSTTEAVERAVLSSFCRRISFARQEGALEALPGPAGSTMSVYGCQEEAHRDVALERCRVAVRCRGLQQAHRQYHSRSPSRHVANEAF